MCLPFLHENNGAASRPQFAALNYFPSSPCFEFLNTSAFLHCTPEVFFLAHGCFLFFQVLVIDAPNVQNAAKGRYFRPRIFFPQIMTPLRRDLLQFRSLPSHILQCEALQKGGLMPPPCSVELFSISLSRSVSSITPCVAVRRCLLPSQQVALCRMASTLPKLPIFEAIAKHDPKTPAVIHSSSRRTFTYGSLLHDVCGCERPPVRCHQTAKHYEESELHSSPRMATDYVGAINL